MTDDLLEQVNARAQDLGLSRSAYIQQLLRADLGLGSSMTMHDNTAKMESTPEQKRIVNYADGKQKRSG